MNAPLLSVQISVDYPAKPSAIHGVEFDLRAGEALGLAGESGSGKSTIALAILRLLEWRGGRVKGRIQFDGRDLMHCRESQLRTLRGKDISLIMQSPAAALNPALRLETHLREAWCAHSRTSWIDARAEVQATLERMGLPADQGFLGRLPSQVSVGQAQRVVIAMAVMHHPKVIVADEPTSALDPKSRQDILDLLKAERQRHGTALIYISHDIPSIQELCDRTLHLTAGRLIPPGGRSGISELGKRLHSTPESDTEPASASM